MKKLFLFAASVLATVSVSAATVEVAAGQDLQAAINGASAGDVVKVQAGTFTGNFTMKEGVNVSGGWDETFTTQSDFATVLDANANGRVLNQTADFTTVTVWSNMTIQNGYLAAQQGDQQAAGAVLKRLGRLVHCLVQNNNVAASGTFMGGGVASNTGMANPDTVVIDCIIRNNKASHGGGMRTNGKGMVILNSVIENNETTNNAAGGLQMHNGGTIQGCVVRGNKANGDTGGIRLTGGNVATVSNCLIAGNIATVSVGGLCLEGNLANVINNTIVGNIQQKADATTSLSGVKVNKDKSANGTYFCNNIIWGNITGTTVSPNGVYYISKYDKTQGQRSYNAIIGQAGDDDNTGATSLNLTTANPGFVDPENGDYRLVWNSALVNFGSNDRATAKDAADHARVQGGRVDLGCYELPYHLLTVTAYENAELKFGEETVSAGGQQVPEGYTTTFTVTPAEGYTVTAVAANENALEAAEGVYTLPAVAADMTLTITTEQEIVTALENTNGSVKVLGVYNLLGTKVGNSLEGMENGVYIVRTTEGSKKVMLK